MEREFVVTIERDKAFAINSAEIKKLVEKELGDGYKVYVMAQFRNRAEEERYYKIQDAIDRLAQAHWENPDLGYPEVYYDEDEHPYFITERGEKCYQFHWKKDGGFQEYPILTEMRKKKIRQWGREDGIPEEELERVIDEMKLDQIIRI